MKKVIFTILFLGVFTILSAQMHGGGQYDPDSLETVSVTGIVITETTAFHSIYYLDIDNDAIADYHLNFGPWWYQPDSSNAVLPENGEEITVEGGLHDAYNMDLSVIVVYEINGEFWREPFYAFWNDLDGHFDGGMGHMGNHNGYAYGWMHDSLETISLSGTALVDTTFFMNQYYLDTNNDTIPEYFLNFGPWWYEPESGAERPGDGDEVEIAGGLMSGHNFDMVVVFEINGEVWRDSSYFAGHQGGGWIHSGMDSSKSIYNPYDHGDHMRVEPGWHQSGGQHGGGMMSDSLFCQFLELYPGDMPNAENENPFMGFEIGMFDPSGANQMMNGGQMGSHLNFNNEAHFQFEYNDIQILGNNIDENTIQAKYWDDQTSSWKQINNISVNVETNSLTFSSSEIPNYIIITADNVTSVKNDAEIKPKEFTLKQNYPNPFNPSTVIEFSLAKSAKVELNIYNILGQKISTLTNKNLDAGIHKYQFNGSSLTSGIYFYEIKANENRRVKKMSLLK